LAIYSRQTLGATYRSPTLNNQVKVLAAKQVTNGVAPVKKVIRAADAKEESGMGNPIRSYVLRTRIKFLKSTFGHLVPNSGKMKHELFSKDN